MSKIRNVSAPKVNEESGSAPRMLKLSLTDGKTTVHGIEMSKLDGISLATAPGTKVKLLKQVLNLKHVMFGSQENRYRKTSLNRNCINKIKKVLRKCVNVRKMFNNNTLQSKMCSYSLQHLDLPIG